MKDKARKPSTTPGSETPSAEVVEIPERWSVSRKTELVLRLLRARRSTPSRARAKCRAHEREAWRRVFLEQGPGGLKTRSDPEERELPLARAKIDAAGAGRVPLADEWKKQRR